MYLKIDNCTSKALLRELRYPKVTYEHIRAFAWKRRRHLIDLYELSAIAGFAAATIRLWESGLVLPHPENFARLYWALAILLKDPNRKTAQVRTK